MNIDFKITTWERITIPKDLEDEILKKVKKGLIIDANGIFELLTENTVEFECAQLLEVEEQMTVKDNGGEATIEVMKGTETIWDNKIK